MSGGRSFVWRGVGLLFKSSLKMGVQRRASLSDSSVRTAALHWAAHRFISISQCFSLSLSLYLSLSQWPLSSLFFYFFIWLHWVFYSRLPFLSSQSHYSCLVTGSLVSSAEAINQKSLLKARESVQGFSARHLSWSSSCASLYPHLKDHCYLLKAGFNLKLICIYHKIDLWVKRDFHPIMFCAVG